MLFLILNHGANFFFVLGGIPEDIENNKSSNDLTAKNQIDTIVSESSNTQNNKEGKYFLLFTIDNKFFLIKLKQKKSKVTKILQTN